MMASFVWGRLRYDLTALVGLLVAVVLGVVPLEDAFDGFSDQVVVIVGSALVVSAGIAKSGVIGRTIRAVEPRMTTPGLRVAFLTSAVAVLSSFVKNIGSLAIFLPIALQIARRSGTSPSILLMPMAFGSLIGGLVTLVGTSPNILVSRVREEVSGRPFGMFDFAPVGLAILGAGLLFLSFGWRLLPRGRTSRGIPEDAFSIAGYVVEATLGRNSRLAGKTVADLETASDGAVTVIAVVREHGRRRYIPAGHWTLFQDDILVLQGEAHRLRDFADDAGLNLVGTRTIPTPRLAPAEIGVVEAVVMAGSKLVGETSAGLQLRDRYGMNLVAISRPGTPSDARLGNIEFRPGDVLILQGSTTTTPAILRDLGCLPLVDRETGLGTPRNDYLPLVVLAATILVIAASLVPVTVAFFGAAVVMIASRVLSLAEAYDSIDVPVLVLLACMIPISDAVNRTGGAELMATGLADLAGGLPPSGVIALVMIAAMAVTPVLNNAATVLIMAPVAAGIGHKLGVTADPLLMAVAIGAACDFLTPIGHQCNTLVFGPGGYRFGDYARLGLPLSLIVLCVGSFLIPLVWSF
ncbi:SLC13 family permease [Rhodoplanes sp. SY1]